VRTARNLPCRFSVRGLAACPREDRASGRTTGPATYPPPPRRGGRGRAGTDARSLRFRFKTFELDWEMPRVFAVVSPGYLKVSRRAMPRPKSFSLRESHALGEQPPSRNYFRSLVLSGARGRIARSSTRFRDASCRLDQRACFALAACVD